MFSGWTGVRARLLHKVTKSVTIYFIMSDHSSTPEGMFECSDFNKIFSRPVENMLKCMDNQPDISFADARDLLAEGVCAWLEMRTNQIDRDYKADLSGLDRTDSESQANGQSGGSAAESVGYIALRFMRLWDGDVAERRIDSFGPAESAWSHGGWQNYRRTYQGAEGTKEVIVARTSQSITYNSSDLAPSTGMMCFGYAHNGEEGLYVLRYDVSGDGSVRRAKAYYGPDGKEQGHENIRLVRPSEIRVAAGDFNKFVARGEITPFPSDN